MLSAATKRQYSSVIPLLVIVCQFLYIKLRLTTWFDDDDDVKQQWIWYFFVWVTLIKVTNTLLERLCQFLSVILIECTAAAWHPANPARNLARARFDGISKKWLDSGFAWSGAKIRYNRCQPYSRHCLLSYRRLCVCSSDTSDVCISSHKWTLAGWNICTAKYVVSVLLKRFGSASTKVRYSEGPLSRILCADACV